MNLMKKCPLLFWIAVSGILLTAAGIIGSTTIYEKQSFDWKKNPYLSLVIKGAQQGVYPWEAPVFRLKDGEAIEMAETDKKISVDEILFGRNADEVMSSKILESEMPEANSDHKTSEQMEQPLEQDDKVHNISEPAAGETAVSGNEVTEAAPSYQTVTEDYFNDALFIGDSRTVGMFEYGGLETRSQFYAKTSLTIYEVLEAPLAADAVTGEKISVEAALSQRQFGKIYLMLGINEMGTGTAETFAAEYAAVVQRIRELQPQAIIFIQSIMNVSGEKSNSDPIFNNPNIQARNTEIAKLADGMQTFYLDVNECVTDAQGNLTADYTGDGVHLKAAYYQLWKEYLLQKGIIVS